MGLKRETITELLQLIESIEICHIKIMTDSVIEEIVQTRIDGYYEQLNELIKADVAEQVEAKKTTRWAERYMDRLEKHVARLERQRDERARAHQQDVDRYKLNIAQLERRLRKKND